MKAKLIRVEETQDGTLGVLIMDGVQQAMTLEPEDKNNEQNVSCIPPDTYVCERVNSPRFGITFEIKNVPNRSHVLFHAGNTEEDTLGCVLLGWTADKLKGKRAVLNSGATFKKFLTLTATVERFELTIVDETMEAA